MLSRQKGIGGKVWRDSEDSEAYRLFDTGSPRVEGQEQRTGMLQDGLSNMTVGTGCTHTGSVRTSSTTNIDKPGHPGQIVRLEDKTSCQQRNRNA